jgi:mRNA interferase RelE/StbE
VTRYAERTYAGLRVWSPWSRRVGSELSTTRVAGVQIEICEVWAVGARADAEVYAEATARVQAASGQQLEIRKLADVIERLGRLSGGVTMPAAPTRAPVPDWLAARLIHTVGMTPQAVAALSLEEAVDRWGDYISKPT